MRSQTNLYIIRVCCCLLIVLTCRQLFAQTLVVNGTHWNVPVPNITEAGNDYAGTYESVSNQITHNTSVPLLLGSAKVSVHYEPDPTWNSNLNLSIRRTSNGSTLCLLCSISGGTAYQPVGVTDIELYRIQAVLALASYSDIGIQLSLSGVSVLIPSGTYNARLVFTVGGL